ncbi:type IV pilus assembly PilZ [Desulforamulus reducens MI-1]|uniref:Type IV pilus assembly PilZ n=1 Tax=Desulforamulus reducens (strain ATCC BAA-1160 / DSM 100696 / MI-1) TaxID=349161 RepID=A4J266_DESRM|nr:PilZ domain-containing protein [Desulforamulus reducens]ABO49169.1 type IV pilus assembly PilZ [Desulforamulus reducens MI-1]
MVSSQELISLKQKILLQTDLQPAFNTTITAIDQDKKIFWVNLPREGNQVLVLQEHQQINIGISLPKGFYQAETSVALLGNCNEKFYGFVIPPSFTETQERKFMRVNRSTNVIFHFGNKEAQTALVNFSAGGIMVYLVPHLENILLSTDILKAHLILDDFPFEIDVQLSWKKQYDHIPFAGFKFINMTPSVQEALSILSTRYIKANTH